MIIRLWRPQVINPMVLPLQNQRTIHTSLGGRTRSLRLEPNSHLSQPQVLRLREYDLSIRRVKTTLVARSTRNLFRVSKRTLVQPYLNDCLLDTLAAQPPKFQNVISP